MIFACHVFAVLFGAQSVAVAAGYLAGNTTVASSLGVGSLLYALIYMVLALRVVYGGTITRALAHTVVVLAFYCGAGRKPSLQREERHYSAAG